MNRESQLGDPLTPPQQRLLDFLRAGTPTAEIAVRLGLPIGEAKDRIQQLLQQLNLSDRTELATWDPVTLPVVPSSVPPPPPPDPPPEPSPADLAVEHTPAEPQSRRPALAVASALGGAIVVGLVVATALFGDTRPPTPATAPLPTEVPLRTPPPRVEFITPALDIPDYTALLLVGCHACGGPPVTLARIARQDRGEPFLEPLFTPEAPACISSAASARGGYDVVLALVSDGACGGTDPFAGDRTTTFLRSTDGGITWAAIGVLPGVRAVVLVAPDGPVIYPATAEGLRASTAIGRWAYLGPDGDLLPIGFDEGKPVGIDDALVWTTGRDLVTASGPIPSPRLPAGAVIDHFAPIPGQARYLLSWVSLDPGSPGTFSPGSPAVTRAIVDRATGEIVTSWVDTSRTYLVSLERLWGPMAFGITVGDDSPRSPHVLNIEARSTHRLSGSPWDELTSSGHLYQLVHMAVGPYAAVQEPPTGDCLEVRRRHASSAPVIGCVPSGVHLRWAYDTYVSLSDVPWGAVILPNGRPGWAPLDHIAHPPVRPIP